jgi:hypothetical protein
MNIELRDYFAGLAMQAIIMGEYQKKVAGQKAFELGPQFVRLTYELADNMLKARVGASLDPESTDES